MFQLLSPFYFVRAVFQPFVAVLSLVSCLQIAAQPFALPEYVAGEHYQILSAPIKLAADDKIEVMEVFWYGCGHCQRFEPVVRAWKKALADDVVFMRTPAVWGKKDSAGYKIMHAHARLYYAAEALDLPEAIHDDLFSAIVANRNLITVADFAPLFARHGVTSDVLKSKLDSFAASTKANKAANRISKNYATGGTPEIIVNGRYRVTSKMGGGMQGMLDVANFLIDLERNRAN